MKTFRRGSIRRDRAAAACLLTFPGLSPGCSCGPVARRPRGPREPMAPMPACPTGCGLIRSMSAHRARPVPGMPSAVTSPQAAPSALAAARARTEAHPTRGARDTTDLVRSFRGGVRAVLGRRSRPCCRPAMRVYLAACAAFSARSSATSSALPRGFVTSPQRGRPDRSSFHRALRFEIDDAFGKEDR